MRGRFAEQEIDQATFEIHEFVMIAKRMYDFLNKFIEVIVTNEKKFEQNLLKMQSLNKFLYEYEV